MYLDNRLKDGEWFSKTEGNHITSLCVNPQLGNHPVSSLLQSKLIEESRELKVGGEGGDRGLDGWMASPTQWT